MPTGSRPGTAQKGDGRMQSVDIVRAMAIVFVVFGHALIYADRGELLMRVIYAFHMPLLFVLSGLVAAASWERSAGCTPSAQANPAANGLAALRKIGRSARRLLLPYAACGLVVMPTVNFLLTGRFATSFETGWRNAFLLNRFLWYLPCCFFLTCIFTAVALFSRRLHGARWLGAVAAAFAVVAATHLALPGIDFLRSVASYFISFFAGAWLWSRRDGILHPARGTLVLSSIAFAALVALHASIPEMPLLAKGAVKSLAGVAAFFPLMAVANAARGLAASAAAYVGRTTLFLYCFDFCATPIAVWYLHPGGILSSFAVAAGVVATGLFVNLAWEYAILPELRRIMTPVSPD